MHRPVSFLLIGAEEFLHLCRVLKTKENREALLPGLFILQRALRYVAVWTFGALAEGVGF